MQLDCPHCRRVIVVPESLSGKTARCPICSGVVPVPFLAAPPPAPPAKANPVIPYDWLALLAYCCPASLLLTMVVAGVYGIGYSAFWSSLSPIERQIPELRQQRYPPGLLLVGIVGMVVSGSGLVLTVTTFTLSQVRKHRLAAIISLSTMAASCPLIGCCCLFGAG